MSVYLRVLGPLLYINVNGAILIENDTTLPIRFYENGMVCKATTILNETYNWIENNRLVLNINITNIMNV